VRPVKTLEVDLAHTADAIDLVSFVERLGHEAKLVPLHRGTALEVAFDEKLERIVREWLAEHHPELLSRHGTEGP
jgi:hypothetical protein